MSSIIDIPNELLEEILAETSFHDLVSLSKTCKTLHTSTIPALYHNITVFWTLPQFSKITSLMRTVLERPAYAEYIKIVNVRFSTQKLLGGGNPLDDCRLQENEKALVDMAIDELQLPHAEQWKAAIMHDNNQGAILSLLLARCINLQSLTTNVYALIKSTRWFTTMVKHAMAAPSGAKQLTRFDKLVHIKVQGPRAVDCRVDATRDTVLLLLYLPDLVRLELDAAAPDLNGSELPLGDAPVATRLTTLRLCLSSAPVNTVGLLLKQTPQLNSLVFDYYLPSSHVCLDLGKLRRGLDHARNTLSSLTIKYDIFLDPDEALDGFDPKFLLEVVTGSLGSLRDFTALTDLEISLAVLYGQSPPNSVPPLTEVLPPTLQRLTINDDLWVYDAFYEWAGGPVMDLFQGSFSGGWKIATPQLKEFVLDIRKRGWISEDYWGQEEQQEELRQICESCGLRCSILYGTTNRLT